MTFNLLEKDKLAELKAEEKALKAQLQSYEAAANGNAENSFLGIVSAMAETMIGCKVPLPTFFGKFGFIEKGGNLLCKALTGNQLSDFFNEFKQPKNIEDLREKLGCNNEAKMKSNPLLGIFGKILDTVAEAGDMAPVIVDKKKVEALEERLEVVSETLKEDAKYREIIKEAEFKANLKHIKKKVSTVKAGQASGEGNEAGAANLSDVNTAGISGGARVQDQTGAGNVPANTEERVRQHGD